LKQKCDELLSNFSGNFNLRHYIEVDAKLSVTAGRAVVKSVIVHFVFDVTYQGPDPAARPMLKVFGDADFNYPCDTGDTVHANLTVDLNIGAIIIPPVRANFVYHCGDRPATQTVYEIDVLMIEPFNVLNMFELSAAHAHVDMYRYPTGGTWFTVGWCRLTVSKTEFKARRVSEFSA
jgi:hypothetical protein